MISGRGIVVLNVQAVDVCLDSPGSPYPIEDLEHVLEVVATEKSWTRHRVGRAMAKRV